jgi:filamentous hemagglutinin family protein
VKHRGRHVALRRSLIAASVAACFALSSQNASANPTGGTVVSGSAAFATAGSTLSVTNSANAIINWQGFSIGINEITKFLQSSAGSAVLNRVIGAGGVIPQSVIDGVLQSNGRVFLLNPMGVVIGSSARIDVAGLVASSLNLSNEDFLAGRLRFTEVPGAGAVVNHGVIETTSGGRVYLVAPDVQNNGIIRAPQGEIVLAAGKSAELISDSSPYVSVRVTADSERALNVGTLVADSGRIGMYGALVRNSGVAEANGAIVGPGGEIRFVATKDLTLDAGSRVSANGTSGGKVVLQAEGGTNLIAGTVEATGNSGKGGEVQALGVRVGVIGHGVIDASGDTGGGTVLVGGDYQGKNPDVQNAQRTFIGLDGVIRADAKTTGDGGRVIVWADGDTGFYGAISAKGGSQSGNGGFVETSGKSTLQAFGRVDTRAPNGRDGEWLLDPTNINVVAGASGTQTDDTFITSTGNDSGGATTSNVSAGAVQDYSGTVTLSANDVNFLASINKANGGLTVSAGSDINLNANVIAVSGPLSMSAASTGSITSTIASGVTQLKTNGRTATLSGYAAVTVGGIDTRATGTVSTDTYVSLSASAGAIKTGAIMTGNTTSSNSYVSASASSGSVTTGDITTGAAATNTYISMSGSGGINTGNLATGSAGVSNRYVNLSSGAGDITTGSITTKSLIPQSGSGQVSITTSAGRVVVNGDIDTRGADGISSYQTPSGSGGVTIYRSGATDPGTAVKVNGSILTAGANAFAGSGISGTSGGQVLIYGNTASVYAPQSSLAGGVTVTGTIDTHGGNGGTNATYGGGNGGAGGTVYVIATGPVSLGSINTSGGAGGTGGSTEITHGGQGGTSGRLFLGGNSITAGALTARGGRGGDGAEGGKGGNSTVDQIATNRYFELASLGAISTGAIDTSGGDTGASTSTAVRTIYAGGWGGKVTIWGNSAPTPAASITTGPIVTKGGAGTSWSGLSGSTGTGGVGGAGGAVMLKATSSVAVGPTPVYNVTPVAINTSGGAGGAGAKLTSNGTIVGAGGAGGSAGAVSIDPNGITINGVVQAVGGAGGAGTSGGTGGAGGAMTLQTTGGTGTITFVNGGYDTSGGAGGATGGAAGTTGTATRNGTVVFAFVSAPATTTPATTTTTAATTTTTTTTPVTTTTNVFSDPAVAQSIGTAVKEALAVAKADDKKTEEENKTKKGSLGSCKP